MLQLIDERMVDGEWLVEGERRDAATGEYEQQQQARGWPEGSDVEIE